MQSTLEKPVIAEISSVEHKTRAVYCVVYYLYQGPYSSSSNLTLSRAPPSWCTTPSGQGFDACFVIKLPILKEVRLTLKPLTLSFFGAYFASGYRVFLCQYTQVHKQHVFSKGAGTDMSRVTIGLSKFHSGTPVVERLNERRKCTPAHSIKSRGAEMHPCP